VTAPAPAAPPLSTDLLFEKAPLRLKACRHGVMMYFATDWIIGRSLDLYGEFSEGEVALFAQMLKPGMTVVDVGANIGAHTVYFATAVGARGRVFAFEPQRIIYQMLCGNVALNMHGNVVAVQAALGASPGRIVVPRVDYTKGGNFGQVALDSAQPGETVNVQTLDAYSLKSCHLIKIDVEGMEQSVLEGARKTLAAHQPILYVENDREEKSAGLIKWLLDAGYRLFWHLPWLFNPNNFAGFDTDIYGLSSINMLCLPKTMNAAVPGLPQITSPTDKWQATLAQVSP